MVTILVPDVGYYYYWFKIIKLEILKIIIQRNETVFRFITFGNVPVKKFYDENINNENSESGESEGEESINERSEQGNFIPGTEFEIPDFGIKGIDQLRIMSKDDVTSKDVLGFNEKK